MDGLLNWVGNILFFLVLITVAENLLPGKKYNKYIRLCAGMVLILLVVRPLTAGLHLEEQINRYFQSFTFQQESKDLSKEILGIEQQRLGQVIDSYEQVVETDLEAMAKEMGLVPVRTAAVINRNRESGDYGLVVRVEMEVEPWPDKGENETDDGRDVVQAVNPVKPVEQVNVDIGKRQENGETEAGTNEDEEQEPLPREGTLEQLRRKVEGYYGLEAGKVEIEFQGR